MLKDKVIIYDDSCPMCKLYTYWFVAWGFLKSENRIGFAAAPLEITSQVDLKRGRHEIPLYDRQTRKTIYGLRALTFILGSRWTWMNPVLESKPFYWLLHPVYEIITYNRRVIAGCKTCCGFDCAPDLNRFYRSIYLGLAGSAIAAVTATLTLANSWTANIATCMIAGLVIAGLIAGGIRRLTNGSLAGWNYAGNYTTTVLIVAAITCPIAFIPAATTNFSWTILTVAILLGLSELRRRKL